MSFGLVISAELCARAIIAAAAVFGDDPVRACTGQRRAKRAVSAAAAAVAKVTGAPLVVVARVFDLDRKSLSRGRGGGAVHEAAVQAAEAAAFAELRRVADRPPAKAAEPLPPPPAPPALPTPGCAGGGSAASCAP
jgi:hypothetical protein